MLRAAGLWSVVVLAVGLATFLMSSIEMVFAFAVVSACFDVMSNPSLESILADSGLIQQTAVCCVGSHPNLVVQSERSRIFAWKHSLTMVAAAVGPTVSCFMFLGYVSHACTP